MEIVPQRQGLKVYLRPKRRYLKTKKLELLSCERVGHWTNGNSYFLLNRAEDIPEAMELIQQAVALANS